MRSELYELVGSGNGVVARVRARGSEVLAGPRINRGTAFTLEERRALGLTGLLPSGVSSLEDQVHRTYEQYCLLTDNLRKWVYLSHLRDRNEVLFYRLLAEHLEEMLPVVYTPTVGLAIERFSHEYRRPRGVFLSVDEPEAIETSLRNTKLRAQDVDLVVVTDSEGILGIGDQGVGGIEIAIGKLALYTAAAGIHPSRALPVVLDMGTDNLSLLNDEMYLGVRHARVRGQRYDDTVEAFVTAVTKLFPKAMLHWEDFGATNARRLLEKYSDRVCTFNDDMQGTAVVVLAAAIAAARAAGTRIRDQRVVIHGAGTSGLGIADMLRELMIKEGLPPEEAMRRFYALGSKGLLVDTTPGLRDFQVPYARSGAEVEGWSRDNGAIGLEEVVSRVRPTMLVGTSTQRGAFTESVVRSMAQHTRRPIVLPLSNPTSHCEAAPEDVLRWTKGRALVATGSPFAPVTLHGTRYSVAQVNNALVFPGLGLGVIVAQAERVTGSMLTAAADALARLSDAGTLGAPLLPSVNRLRAVSAGVAVTVARAAVADGVARAEVDNPIQQVQDRMWLPQYPRLEVVDA